MPAARIRRRIPGLIFTNNTVLFMWSFKQNLETMGYGFRFQPGTDCYLANNIFGCSMFTALDYTHIDSDKNREATRNTVVRKQRVLPQQEHHMFYPWRRQFHQHQQRRFL